MDNTQNTPKPLTKEKRAQAVDSTLGSAKTTLRLAEGAKDVIPVAAVGAVIPVLKTIVEKIQVSVLILLLSSVMFHTRALSENTDEQ
jgi:hypothetical protein